MSLELLVLIAILAFFCEWVDSSLGMGYGTIMSPTLIFLGLPPLVAVPAILISQAMSGLGAAYFHHTVQNAQFHLRDENGNISEDLKTVIWISLLGIIASVIASFVGSKLIDKQTLSLYIGTLVVAIGFFVLIGFSFEYSARKMVFVGMVSAFNKGLSGGGFGPLVTGSQIVLGNAHRSAVAITTLSEAPICIAGFVAYLVFNGFQMPMVALTLTLGSVSACKIGAHTTKHLEFNLRWILGVLLLILGAITLLKTLGYISFSLSM